MPIQGLVGLRTVAWFFPGGFGQRNGVSVKLSKEEMEP
jgi:hypothetical protein